MTRVLSSTAKQALFAQQTDEVFAVLLTIEHSSFSQPVRISSDPKEDLPEAGVKGIVSRGDEYIYPPFSLSLPSQDDTVLAKANISIDNVSREMISHVRGADSALSIKIEVILASDPDTVEISMSQFKLERVTYDALTVNADISVEYFDLEPFPARRFTPADFPGMF